MENAVPEQFVSLTISVIGTAGCGKTSLIKQYSLGTFSSDGYPQFQNASIVNHAFRVSVGKKSVHYHILDYNPQGALFDWKNNDMYCRGDFLLLIYDVTSKRSFRVLKEKTLKYLVKAREMNTTTQSFPKLIVIGNKIDLTEQRLVPYRAGKRLADELGGMYVETSAATRRNIVGLFGTIALMAVKESAER